MVEDKVGLVEYRVLYPCTNEYIPSIIDGLDLKPSGVVISIDGSGDVPLAIAPYVRKVYAVDRDEAQIMFMREQISFLNKGDFGPFYRAGSFNSSNGFDVKEGDIIQRELFF
ncbi:hypothetical protein KAI32_01475 [Candidatus Pacearchaeota archaeon]|nr:hypothetical protein [Candidatus Pacearchaeota archaeon]